MALIGDHAECWCVVAVRGMPRPIRSVNPTRLRRELRVLCVFTSGLPVRRATASRRVRDVTSAGRRPTCRARAWVCWLLGALICRAASIGDRHIGDNGSRDGVYPCME